MPETTMTTTDEWSHQNIAMMFNTEKPEWCGYTIVKIFWKYVYSFWQNVQTWHTDGQTVTAWWQKPRLHSITWQQYWHWQNVSQKCRWQMVVVPSAHLWRQRPVRCHAEWLTPLTHLHQVLWTYEHTHTCGNVKRNTHDTQILLLHTSFTTLTR